MKFKMKGLIYFMLCCFVLSNSAFASKQLHKHWFSHNKRGHFEVLGSIGAAQLNAGNSNFAVTSSETDRLVQTNSNQWDTLAGQGGVGYVYNIHFRGQHTGQVKWFPSIEPEFNIYHLASDSIKGDVWRFGSSAFNDLTFDIPIHSTRLMLDAALTVAAWRQFSIYAIGGIGNVWNRLDYSDVENGNAPPCPLHLELDSKTSSHFAWEAGAGLIYAVNHRVGVSVEYLYADLGTARTATSGSFATATAQGIAPARFKLKSNQVLAGLHIAL